MFKWPYKETKLIARRQGRVIAASAPIPHDLRNINAAVASASTTSLSSTFVDSSSTSSSSTRSSRSSSSSGKRKSRSTSEAVSGGSANGSTVRGTAGGAKRQRVAPVRASTKFARDTARDTKSPWSACSSRSRSSSSRSYQYVVPTPIKGPEREEQLRIEDVGELAQSRGWDPDDIEDPDEKAHANSCERSTRGHNLGPNDPHLQHNEEQENDEDEGREGEGNFEDDGGIAGLWQYTMKECSAQSDGRRLMRPDTLMRHDTPPGLREATGSDNGYDQECGHFEPEDSAMGRDRQPVHGNLSEMYGCDTRYSGAYGRLMADSITRPVMAHVCDMPSSAAMPHAAVCQVSSFTVECSQGCGTQCLRLSARLATSLRIFLLTLLVDCMQAPMHAYNGGNGLHTHLRSAATSTQMEEMPEHSSSPADCFAGTLHMGCIGTLNEQFDVN